MLVSSICFTEKKISTENRSDIIVERDSMDGHVRPLASKQTGDYRTWRPLYEKDKGYAASSVLTA